MDDSKLLELAGLAAGETYSQERNPLERDDLALRLAVKLHLTVSVGLGGITVTDAFRNPLAVIWHDNDPYAATRRAIVRAALRLKLEGA